MSRFQIDDYVLKQMEIMTKEDTRLLFVVKSDKDLYFCDTMSDAIKATGDNLTDALISMFTGKESPRKYLYKQVPKSKTGSVDPDLFMEACGYTKNSVIGDDIDNYIDNGDVKFTKNK